MANLFVPDQYNLWIHLLTAVVRQSWNHRGLGDRGKAGLTVTHLLSQIPLWNNSCCSRAVGERTGECSRIGGRHNNRFAIVSDPLSYLYTSASPGKLIALHCRKAPVSKQPNSWRAKKCQMAKKGRMRFKSSPHVHKGRACDSFKCVSHMWQPLLRRRYLEEVIKSQIGAERLFCSWEKDWMFKGPAAAGLVVMLVGNMVIGNRVEVDSWRYCNWQERQENRWSGSLRWADRAAVGLQCQRGQKIETREKVGKTAISGLELSEFIKFVQNNLDLNVKKALMANIAKTRKWELQKLL